MKHAKLMDLDLPHFHASFCTHLQCCFPRFTASKKQFLAMTTSIIPMLRIPIQLSYIQYAFMYLAIAILWRAWLILNTLCGL